jgi:hypothetical protein
MKTLSRLPPTAPGVMLLGLTSLLACRGEDSAYARSAGVAGGVTIVEPPRSAYIAERVVNGGTLTGTVTFTGPAPEDSISTVARDERICGATIRQGGVEADDDRLRGALVWLSDIRRGRPLPLARRFQLGQEDCRFSPRVQAVVAGGGLNVLSHDAMASRSAVVDMRTLDTLVILPFTDAGVVIPLDAPLQRPRMLHVRSTTHPWMEAWVAVLDHPYFAESGEDGAFSIEGVPPGEYEVRAWHPAFGLTRASVTIRGGATQAKQLRFDNGNVSGEAR